MRTQPAIAAVALGSILLAGLARADAAKPVVTLSASVPVTDETAVKPGEVIVTRDGDLSAALTVEFSLGGSAKPGTDYHELPRTITLPAQEKTAVVKVEAIGDFDRQPARTVVLHLKPSPAYQVGNVAEAVVTINDVPPQLFIAQIRPTAEASESTAYGTATLLLAPDRSRARIVVMHANLTSPLVSSHLKLAAPGAEGAYLLNFSREARATFEWALQPTGQFTTATLQAALESGRIYVGLDSKNHPTGELRGYFIRAAGSEKFQPPPAPPKLPGGPLTERDAARFLTQATFGPTRTEIAEFVHPTPRPNEAPPKPQTFEGWINEQLAIPASSHLEEMRADFRAFPPDSPRPRIGHNNRQEAWLRIALTGPDQLRQRVAFALSEIFVISDVNDTVANNAEGAAVFYDLLARDAFGNFRQLLEDVTFSPAMGAYLSHLKSAKADPKRGTSADENYAREVMQLFTIGLNELQPDGTYRLGPDGLPIPTYDQHTIEETARVFTGLGFYSPEPRPNFGGARANFAAPMMTYPEQHDDGEKVIVGGVKLHAKQGPAADLRQMLDTLFNHPNTAPFICRQLIQRLVTSNPSPGYIYRVSQVFAKNGHGERGDLGAVIRAILLDYEARSPDVTGNLGYGKMKEPLLQATALLRAFQASAANGRYYYPNPEGPFGQAPLRSPTVFNFFEPDYVLPGPLAAAGLHAPEYQILTASTGITIPNQLRNFVYATAANGPGALVLKLDPLAALAKTPEALVDYLDLVFCAASLSPKARAIVLDKLTQLPPTTSDLDLARSALDLIVSSPDAAIQH
ncbi:DUF1800 family protein [Opitutus sp. GAS368]|uniref:DUF1800 family protein n=1 Tax=Opitutus sp. GAS368 TaxID=1882749 RepID=UPI00087DC488|nr:DUF1800 family protein [Opitutus sp. GAS368]SDR68026.1 Uncharacterized conserved protein, DUF1800 family [Opitutus sp. GAS368]